MRAFDLYMDTQARNQTIIRYYLEGHTLQAVADYIGNSLTREGVRQILKKNGALTARRSPKRPRSFKKKPKLTSAERFWSKVNKEGPIHPVLLTACWLWTGSGSNVTGYGRARVFGQYTGAHRASLWLTTLRKPVQWVLHKCDNPPCVNPDHLYEGTPKENAMDRELRSGRTQLSWEMVEKIRQKFDNGEHIADIAHEFHASPTTIYLIKLKKTWNVKQGRIRRGRIRPDIIQQVIDLGWTKSRKEVARLVGIGETSVGYIRQQELLKRNEEV